MTKSVRVMNVLGELRPSGAEVMLLEAVPLLRDFGIDPSVLSTGAVPGDFATAYTAKGIRVDHVPFERGVSFACRFVQLIRRRRPDVVHVHTERANAALCSLARASGVRVVRTVHNVFHYNGRLQYVRTLERCALRALGVEHITIGRAVEENERHRLKNPSHRIDNWIGQRFRPPSPAERAAARRQLGVSDGQYVMSSVGNCSDVKNHMAILEALPAIARRAGRQVVYLHVGTGPDEAREREVAQSLTGSVVVNFLGSVRDVMPILWASDAFCMPSRYEGVPIAALEAAACGLPSVLSDADGMRDVHPEAATVRFEPPTAAGVTQGIAELQSIDPDTLQFEALVVSASVRSQRDARARIEQLVGVYLGDTRRTA